MCIWLGRANMDSLWSNVNNYFDETYAKSYPYVSRDRQQYIFHNKQLYNSTHRNHEQ